MNSSAMSGSAISKSRIRCWLAIGYILSLVALMWLPLGGLGIPMNNFVLGIRLDHLYHAAVYLPAVGLLYPFLGRHFLYAWLGCLLLCIVTESVQMLLPYRGFDINDLLANMIGVSVGAGMARLFHQKRVAVRSR